MEPKHKIDDVVTLNLGISGIIPDCVICAVKFTEDKIRYDVLIPVIQTSPTLAVQTSDSILTDFTCTKIQNVDSAMVIE
jgi:hypothetical protein